jgi:hypothetical protein
VLCADLVTVLDQPVCIDGYEIARENFAGGR